MTDIMVDLETMGSGKNAAIVQIGAVKFVAAGAPLPDELVEGSPATFLRNVSLESSLQLGMQVDGDTVMWWLGQSAEARKALFDPKPIPIRDALTLLQSFIGRNEYNTVRVWAKGSSFDAAILDTAYRMSGNKWGAWSYTGDRDVRTVIDLAGLDETDFAAQRPERTAHNALSDAWYQATMVQECYWRLGKSASLI